MVCQMVSQEIKYAEIAKKIHLNDGDILLCSDSNLVQVLKDLNKRRSLGRVMIVTVPNVNDVKLLPKGITKLICDGLIRNLTKKYDMDDVVIESIEEYFKALER